MMFDMGWGSEYSHSKALRENCFTGIRHLSVWSKGWTKVGKLCCVGKEAEQFQPWKKTWRKMVPSRIEGIFHCPRLYTGSLTTSSSSEKSWEILVLRGGTEVHLISSTPKHLRIKLFSSVPENRHLRKKFHH